MKKIFLWGILQGIPYNKLTSIIGKNHHRSRTKLLAYWQELSNPTVYVSKAYIPNLRPLLGPPLNAEKFVWVFVCDVGAKVETWTKLNNCQSNQLA